MSDRYLQTAVAIAREAGVALRERFARDVRVEAKGRFDLVTDADAAVEASVVAQLRAAFPSHGIVAEESGRHAGTSSVFRWHVDPLDGTKNFARGYPAFSVSLALERDSELIVGVVLDPMRDEMFAGERGGGAYCNGARLQVSRAERLEQCLVTTGFPSAARHGRSLVPQIQELLLQTQGLRRTGSSALDLSYVASGRLDAFWDIGLRSWDIAAGLVLLAEAGGRCSDLRGEPFHFTCHDLLATNARVHAALVSAFSVVAPAS